MQGQRGHLSAEQKGLAFRLRARGWRLADIAREIGCTAPMVGLMVRDGRHRHGEPFGWQPRQGCLTIGEREQILLGIGRRESLSAIARRLAHAPSTITREVQANGGREHYSAWHAHTRAREQIQRPKPCTLRHGRLLREVSRRLEQLWSPQEISRRLRLDYPDDPEMRVSHETIYMSLFVQGRGALRKELHQALRTGRAIRRPKAALSVPVAALPRLASAIIFASSRSASRVPAPGLGFLSGAWIVFARWIGEPFALRPTYTRRRQTPGATSCLVPFMLAIVVD